MSRARPSTNLSYDMTVGHESGRLAAPSTPSFSSSVRQSVGRQIITPRASNRLSMFKKTVQASENARPRFDLLRLREWFNQLDSERTGSITKRQWSHFVHGNQDLCKLLLQESAREACILGKEAHREAEAVQLRKMFKVWEKIDIDKNGTLEWDEFVEFFRLNGFLLEYEEKDNPKDRMAEVLKDMHEGNVNTADLEEFGFLQRRHLDSTRRHNLSAIATIDIKKMDLSLDKPVDWSSQSFKDNVSLNSSLMSGASTRCPSPYVTASSRSPSLKDWDIQ